MPLVTHGIQLTCLHSLLYVVMLSAVSALLSTLGIRCRYLVVALALDAVFLAYFVPVGATTATRWPGAPSAGRSYT